MNKLTSLLIFVMVLGLAPVQSQAQFEGKIIFNSFKVDENGSREQNDQFTMYVTANRILLQGKNTYDFIGSIKTEGVLVRLDFEDFVFLTGDNWALKISKADINSMINMFGEGESTAGNSRKMDREPEIDVEQTGETETINGYRSEKFIFRDRDDRQDYAVVWMTTELPINWGMLAEPWGNSANAMMGGEFPMGMIFDDGYFPVRVERYDSGTIQSITEAEEISETSVAKAMVQVPSGVTVLSFQDYLFQKMSEQ